VAEAEEPPPASKPKIKFGEIIGVSTPWADS
jgi:hypothetical protein